MMQPSAGLRTAIHEKRWTFTPPELLRPLPPVLTIAQLIALDDEQSTKEAG